MRLLKIKHCLLVGITGMVIVLALTWPAAQRTFSLDDDVHLRIFPAQNADESLLDLLILPHWQQITNATTWRPIPKLIWRVFGVGSSGRTWHLWLLTALFAGGAAGRFDCVLPTKRKGALLALAALMPLANPLTADVLLPFVGQSDLIAALGAFGAWVCWRHRGWLWAFAGALAMAMALFSKESAYPAVLAVPIMLWLLERGRRHRWHAAIIALILSVLLLGARLSIQFALFGGLAPTHSAATDMASQGERVFGTFEAIGHHAWALLAPTIPQTDYTFWVQPNTSAGPFPMIGVIATLLWIGALAMSLLPTRTTRRNAERIRAKRTVAAGLIWIALFLTPYLHLVSLGAVWAGRFLFLPLFGLSIIAVGLADLLPRRRRMIPLIWMIALIAIGFLRIPDRARDWESPHSLWVSEVTREPEHALAWLNLASALQSRGDLAGALNAARRATLLRPAYGEAWLARGEIAWAAGLIPEAGESLLRAESLLPEFANVQIEIAKFVAAFGHLEEAERRLLGVLDREPDNAHALEVLQQVQWDLAHP